MFQVCSDLRDPSTHLNETTISYFTPFRPMLGQRASIDQVKVLRWEHKKWTLFRYDVLGGGGGKWALNG